jgi:uncharacterized protein YwqG
VTTDRTLLQLQGRDAQDATTPALDQLKQQVKQTTDAAVAEGQRNVEETKAAGEGYIEQAKQIATNIVGTAQV